MTLPSFLMSPSNDRFVDRLIVVMLVVAAGAIGLAEGHYYYQAILLLCLMVGVWLALQRPDRDGLARLYGLQRSLAVAATAWLFLEWFALRAEVVTLGHFAILLSAILMLRPRSTRDQTLLVVLILLLIIIGAIVSSNLEFGVALLLFVILLPFACARLHLQQQREAADRQRLQIVSATTLASMNADAVPMGRATVFIPAAKASATALFAGLLLFFAFPRFGSQIAPWRSGSGPMVTGDTAEAELGAEGNVQSLQRPVMRVWLELKGQELGPKDILPYFRSAALEEYIKFRGGRFRWRHSRRPSIRRDSVPTVEELEAKLRRTGGPDPKTVAWLDQWYDFLKRPPQTLYGVFPVMAFESDELSVVEQSPIDSSLIVPTGRRPRDLFYFARSPLRMTDKLAAWLRKQADPDDLLAPAVPPDWRPPSHVISIKIRDTARQVAGVESDNGDPRERLRIANRIRDYLTAEPFEYTLDLPSHPPDEDPVAHFLTVVRRGHCMYYASAMVLMCQSLGIPARLGEGYLGGEYNDVGKYFFVKESDAHAWAEVYIPGDGWRIFDPSPPIEREDKGSGLIAWAMQAIQVAQYEWITRVVAFDREQRRRLYDQAASWLTENSDERRGPFAAIAHTIGDGWTRLRGASWPAQVGVALLGLLSTVAMVWLLRKAWRWLPRRRAGGRFVVKRDAAFIHELLARLAERGYRRMPQQTMREFVTTLPPGLVDSDTLAGVVDIYYDAQFSGRALSEDRRRRVHEALRRLRPNGNGRSNGHASATSIH